MKNHEQRLLDTFADKSMEIHPKFKKKLRQQITTKPRTKRGIGWPKLVLIPALGLVAAIVIFAGIQKPEQNRSPFKPQPVSAAELISRSEAAADNPGDYTFAYIKHQTSTGLGFEPDNAAMGAGKSSGEMYVFKAKKSNVEIYYTVNNDENRPPGVSAEDWQLHRKFMVYDNTDKEVIKSLDMFARPTSLSQVLDGKLLDFADRVFTDEAGVPLANDTFNPIMRNGRMVYAIQAKPGSTPEGVNAYEHERKIVQVIVDARTYRTLGYGLYNDRVSVQTRIWSTTIEESFERLSEFQALQRMQKAGFDKQKAKTDF